MTAALPHTTQAGATRESARTLTRLHALGDSLTVGILDVATNRRTRPWTSWLVEMLGGQVTAGAGTARSGATSVEVARVQLPAVDLARGDLVGLWMGANDVLRSWCTWPQTRSAVGEIFDRIERAGAVPLTMQLPRVSEMLPGPSRLMRHWDEYAAAINTLVSHRTSEAGGIHLDWPRLPGMRGPDGAHLSSWGHYWYAKEYAVSHAGRLDLPPPSLPREPVAKEFAAADRWRWYAKHGGRWLLRRLRTDDPARAILNPAHRPSERSAVE